MILFDVYNVNTMATSIECIESARWLVLGNVDSGKSSFVSVIKKNILDDGRGYARSLITNLPHEKETGRTSNHSHHYVITDNRVTTLIDLCGHEKYMKTTMFGVTGLFGDYGIVVIGSNMGISHMTKEHLTLLAANKIPFIIIVTKIDISVSNVARNIKKDIVRLTKICKKECLWINEKTVSINKLLDGFTLGQQKIIPVIFVSNKTGYNINYVRSLITNAKPRYDILNKQESIIENVLDRFPRLKKPSVMYIDNVYSVPGIGIVVYGIVKYSSIKLGQKMWIGPVNKSYIQVTIKSIRNCLDNNVTSLSNNESGSFALRFDNKNSYSRSTFRKGQILISDFDFAMANTCYSFSCDISVFNHQSTIRNGYQSIIHHQTVRQVAKFYLPEESVLRTGLKQTVNIKFMIRPEFILPGNLFMFRDGLTKGMGRVISTLQFMNDTPEPSMRPKRRLGRNRCLKN